MVSFFFLPVILLVASACCSSLFVPTTWDQNERPTPDTNGNRRRLGTGDFKELSDEERIFNGEAVVEKTQGLVQRLIRYGVKGDESMLSKIVAEIAQKVLSQQEETQRQIKTAISLVQQGMGPWSLDLENIKWPTYEYALKHVAGLIEDPVEQAKALGRVDKQVKEYKEFLMPALQDK